MRPLLRNVSFTEKSQGMPIPISWTLGERTATVEALLSRIVSLLLLVGALRMLTRIVAALNSDVFGMDMF